MKKTRKFFSAKVLRCQSVDFKYQAGEKRNKTFRVIYTLNQMKSMFGLWGEGKTGDAKENPRGAKWRASKVIRFAAQVQFQIRLSPLSQHNAAPQADLKFSSSRLILASRAQFSSWILW